MIRDRVKELRKQEGITVQELAQKIGISLSGLNQNMDGNPSLKVMTEIADALNVPVWQLLVSPEEAAKYARKENVAERTWNSCKCPVCGAPLRLIVDTRKEE